MSFVDTALGEIKSVCLDAMNHPANADPAGSLSRNSRIVVTPESRSCPDESTALLSVMYCYVHLPKVATMFHNLASSSQHVELRVARIFFIG